MCILVADVPAPAALREVSGGGAFVETHLRPDLGRAVTLYHPEAGTIHAEVVGCERDGIRLSFDRSEGAVAFALAAITADMSKAD